MSLFPFGKGRRACELPHLHANSLLAVDVKSFLYREISFPLDSFYIAAVTQSRQTDTRAYIYQMAFSFWNARALADRWPCPNLLYALLPGYK